MFNDNSYMPISPVSLNKHSNEIDKEIILKENFNKELVEKLNSKKIDIILPDDIKIKDKKKKFE